MSDKLQELGIPQHEITPSVSIAVTGLLDHVTYLNKTLNELRENFSNLQSLVDVDTGSTIPNRKALIKRLTWSIALSKRYAGSTSVITFSIHDFESINRTYGYEASSRLAAYTGEFIANNIRDTDFLARINQNQFSVIMYFAEANDVKIKAEKLCDELRNRPFHWNNGLVNINLSFGAHAVSDSDDAESALLASINTMFVHDTKTKFAQVNFKA